MTEHEPDYSDPPAPPTLLMHRPGSEPRWVTHDVVARHEGVADKDEPTCGYTDDYVLLDCPFCDEVFADWGFMQTIWQDYDMHCARAHVGTKWATVTVVGEPKYGFREREAGRHFSRHVETGRVDMLDFELLDSDSTRPRYEATFEVGRWNGSVENDRLAKHLRDRVDFDAFVDVDVEWHHTVPRDVANPSERIEVATWGGTGD